MANSTPSCPWCGERELVERIDHPTGEWFCSTCNGVFTGTEREWHQAGPLRRAKRAKERLTVEEGDRLRRFFDARSAGWRAKAESEGGRP